MVLSDPIFITFFDDQVGFEGHVEWDEDASIGKKSDISELVCSDPF